MLILHPTLGKILVADQLGLEMYCFLESRANINTCFPFRDFFIDHIHNDQWTSKILAFAFSSLSTGNRDKVF